MYKQKLQQIVLRKRRQALEYQEMMDRMAYTQGGKSMHKLWHNPPLYIVGSVPYGLPCLAVTRRNQVQQYQQYELERVNLKLCQIMRVPADFVDVEQESESQVDDENLMEGIEDSDDFSDLPSSEFDCTAGNGSDSC